MGGGRMSDQDLAYHLQIKFGLSYKSLLKSKQVFISKTP